MGVVNLDFWEMLMYTIGAPYSANALQALMEWQRFEGGDAQNNPLNCEIIWTNPRSHDYNSAGVQDYVTGASGIGATAATLLNGLYPSIVTALREGTPVNEWNTPAIEAELSKWGTHDFVTYLQRLPKPPAPQPQPQPIEDDDMPCVVRVPNGSAYLLGGDYMIPISDGPTETKWINAGAKVVDLSEGTPGDVLMYQRLIAKFPDVAPASPAAPEIVS